MTRRVPEGPWDPSKIPRIQILMSQDVCLVGVGVVPFPQVERQSDELDESVDSSWTDRIGLITRCVASIASNAVNSSHAAMPNAMALSIAAKAVIRVAW